MRRSEGGTAIKALVALAAGALVTASFAPALAQNLSKRALINQAVLAAPKSRRAGATVVTFNAKGFPKVLRQGTNDIFCTPNRANSKMFAVHCYANVLRSQVDLQARDRALGKSAKAIRADIHAARTTDFLPQLRMGTAIYSLTGKTRATAKGMWVLLMPGLTQQETQLPTKPTSQGTPWLMRAGTVAAHIHIPQRRMAAAM